MKRFCISFLIISLLMVSSIAFSKPSYTVSISYGIWSLWFGDNIIENLIEDSVKSNLQEQVQDDFPEEVIGEYTQDINVDSSGGGFAFQLRFYPKGEKGVFSLGLLYYKNDTTINLNGNVIQYFIPQENYIELNADGFLELNYSAFLIDLRWDMLPSKRIRPYISFGVGLSPLKGKIVFNGEGKSVINNEEESYAYSEEEKLEDIEDIPTSIIPVVQLLFGLRGELVEHMSIFVDAGVWNGFMVKFGLSLNY